MGWYKERFEFSIEFRKRPLDGNPLKKAATGRAGPQLGAATTKIDWRAGAA